MPARTYVMPHPLPHQCKSILGTGHSVLRDISLFKIMSLCLHNLISSCYIFEHHVTVFSADASTFVSRHRESANHSERANSPLNLFVCGSDDYVKL